MGTRADFYVGRGAEATWLGSIAWDGYPDGIDKELFDASTVAEYTNIVNQFLSKRDDATFPKDGWPWPWENSQTTDYAYSFDDNRVWGSRFGRGWWEVKEYFSMVIDNTDPDVIDAFWEKFDNISKVEFPDMTAIQRIAYGKNSGVIFVSIDRSE